jgi:hypothetical protein
LSVRPPPELSDLRAIVDLRVLRVLRGVVFVA